MVPIFIGIFSIKLEIRGYNTFANNKVNSHHTIIYGIVVLPFIFKK